MTAKEKKLLVKLRKQLEAAEKTIEQMTPEDKTDLTNFLNTQIAKTSPSGTAFNKDNEGWKEATLRLQMAGFTNHPMINNSIYQKFFLNPTDGTNLTVKPDGTGFYVVKDQGTTKFTLFRELCTFLDTKYGHAVTSAVQKKPRMPVKNIRGDYDRNGRR